MNTSDEAAADGGTRWLDEEERAAWLAGRASFGPARTGAAAAPISLVAVVMAARVIAATAVQVDRPQRVAQLIAG